MVQKYFHILHVTKFQDLTYATPTSVSLRSLISISLFVNISALSKSETYCIGSLPKFAI